MAQPLQAYATAPIPPQNLDAEESVLGAMMLSAAAIEDVAIKQSLLAEMDVLVRVTQTVDALMLLANSLPKSMSAHSHGDPGLN